MQEYIQAVATLIRIVKHGSSLDDKQQEKGSPLARQITYGVLREYYSLNHIVDALLEKPLPAKHLDLKLLLLCGIYSIQSLNRPSHASVNAVVESTIAFKKKWSKGLVNAILRHYIRKKDLFEDLSNTSIEVLSEHPHWLASRIVTAWPDTATDVFKANNTQPPMTLRVNRTKNTRAEYLSLLKENGIDAKTGTLTNTSIILASPCPVDQLPGFFDGLVSIQDEASQLAAIILNTQSGDRVLDACAAPGGKTCHLLEENPAIDLVANDKDEQRLTFIQENLERLDQSCQLLHADLLSLPTRSLSDKSLSTRSFDKILLDAPCSATGIIRRHPDIKLLRRNSDIDKLCAMQSQLLSAAWDLLKDEGGEILYSTCSLLPDENDKIVAHFLASRADIGDAQVVPIQMPADIPACIKQSAGIQLLPTTHSHDGFYYAHLRKLPKEAT